MQDVQQNHRVEPARDRDQNPLPMHEKPASADALINVVGSSLTFGCYCSRQMKQGVSRLEQRKARPPQTIGWSSPMYTKRRPVT